MPNPSQQQAEQRLIRRVFLLTAPLGLAALVLLPNLGPVVRTFSIPANSMAPNVPRGSYVVVSRLSYGYSRYSFDEFELPIAGRWPEGSPARGDVIVFRLAKDHTTPYIKRVVGLPGETVQMISGRLVINGTTVERGETIKLRNPDPDMPQDLVPTFIERLPGGTTHTIIETDGDKGFLDNTPVFKVPADHFFVMGDNRDNSQDSRVTWAVGFVAIDHIIGRVVLVWKAQPIAR